MIVGYRRFKLEDFVQKPRLQGAFGTFWESAELEAECHAKNTTAEAIALLMGIRPQDLRAMGVDPEVLAKLSTSAPDLKKLCEQHILNDAVQHCKCGIYVTKDRGPGRGTQNDWPVLAQVVAWGAYVEYEEGWRAQHVKIDQIWLNRGFEMFAPALIERYKVTVHTDKVTCCTRPHTSAQFVENGEEKPICQLSLKSLDSLLILYKRMKNVPYGEKMLAELSAEFAARGTIPV